MNQQISRLGAGIFVLFLILFAQLARIQYFTASSLQEHPSNGRPLVTSFSAPRGDIITADGVVVATSRELESGPFERERVYPEGDLYSETVGFISFNAGSDGLERSWDEELRGEQNPITDSIRELFGSKSDFANVNLTISSEIQQAAKDALGERKGAVVVLNAQTGAILSQWSWPTYDANPLASVDTASANQARLDLLSNPDSPLLPRTTRELYFPGSTFKVVTAASALDNGLVRLDFPIFPDMASYEAPLTNHGFTNFGGSTCGGTLKELLRRSCNTGIAQMTVELLGAERLVGTAELFGFNEELPVSLPNVAVSVMPTDFGESLGSFVELDPALEAQLPEMQPVEITDNIPALAQVSSGQFDVKATPLQMALVAATIANDGEVPKPHVVKTVVGSDGSILHKASFDPWRRAISAQTATELREAMVNVVDDGTATRLQIDGLAVGAKTGTAQIGGDVEETHAWVIAFAGTNVDRPDVAIAVLVEADAEIGQQTGGRVAAPIAKQVIEAWKQATK